MGSINTSIEVSSLEKKDLLARAKQYIKYEIWFSTVSYYSRKIWIRA